MSDDVARPTSGAAAGPGAASPLADAASPFLRHGAEQPVAWRPWGEAAFDEARASGRPVLLDIGAVWCHWCHVMDRESYEDGDTAALINERFVPVKVDRDERPDVDARYQRAVQIMSGQGGWPLTAFLTPDGDVFYAGTYFPPDDRYGRPSFTRVLTELSRIWTERPERAREAATGLNERLEAVAQAEAADGTVDAGVADAIAAALADAFDERNGGFGAAPKFPNAPGLQLLLDYHLADGDDASRRIVEATLAGMARGGIRDQLGGGFHRYSVDARWNVPHFEKMAYDNALLLELYSRAAAAWDDDALRRVAAGVVAMYDDVAPDVLARGGFPASQDADVGAGDDGAYWTWTEAEVREAVADDVDAALAITRFGVDTPDGAMPEEPERHVLYLARDLDSAARGAGLAPADAAERMARVVTRMKRARDGRPRPFVDETVYTGWSALLATGFLAAGRWGGVEGAAPTALRALDALWGEGPTEHGLPRRLGDADAGCYLEDQAYWAAAALDAFEFTQDDRWLERARQLVDLVLVGYAAAEGGFVDRPAGLEGEGLLRLPHRPIVDAPEPAANAVMALSLLRLEALTGAERYRDVAERTLASFAGAAPRLGTMAATYARAVDWLVRGPTHVVVVAPADAEVWRRELATPRARLALRRLEPDAAPPQALPEELRAMLRVTPATRPRAYLCADHTCTVLED